MPFSPEELHHLMKKLERAGFSVQILQVDDVPEPTADERWDAMIRRLTPAAQTEGAS